MTKATEGKMPEVQRVWDVRRELARNAYETPERMSGAIERLLDMLPPSPVPPVPSRHSARVPTGPGWKAPASADRRSGRAA